MVALLFIPASDGGFLFRNSRSSLCATWGFTLRPKHSLKFRNDSR